jgi:2-polyprenyl-3-methyl-5-hydroxy-6-metoxy-1,4-benzoquinol methylase
VQALSLYLDQSLGVRLHTRLRAWSAPLDAVVAAIPREGSLLDVGCGHGLIANEVALRNPAARVLGIDLSETKIAAAQGSVGSRPNLEFRLAPLATLGESGFDAVSLIDVLYLVPGPSWDSFLTDCLQKLKPGGVFVLKEIGTAPRWKFERLKLQEFVSTRILRITKGETMHFESAEALGLRLSRIGFEAVTLARLDAGYTSPHILLTARRPHLAGPRQ